MIIISINGKDVQGEDGWTILKVARWHALRCYVELEFG
jgi:hypothetical protein